MTDNVKETASNPLPLNDFLKLTIDYNADLPHFLHGPKDSAFERVRPVVPPELFDRLPRMFVPANEDEVFGNGARDFLRQADEKNGGNGVPIIVMKERDEEEEEVAQPGGEKKDV